MRPLILLWVQSAMWNKEETASRRKDEKRVETTMSKRMIEAIRVHQYGGPEQLKLEQIPCPKPQAGEVLIHVHAAGVLPAEWKVRQGLFKNFVPASFPYIPGS